MNSSIEQFGRTGRRPWAGETRQRLLSAAAPLIAELGWERVTTRAVAERADLPLGAVSYHFRDKRELLSMAALDTVEAVFPLRELAAVETLAGLLGMVKTSVDNREAFDPVVAAVLLETMRESGRDPELRRHMTALLADYRRLLAELIRAEQDRGAVDARTDPAALATLVAGAADGLLLHALMNPELDVTTPIEALLGLLGGGDPSSAPTGDTEDTGS